MPSQRRIARQKARLHRLVRKGLAPAGDKASMRALGNAAAALGKGAVIPEEQHAARQED